MIIVLLAEAIFCLIGINLFISARSFIYLIPLLVVLLFSCTRVTNCAEGLLLQFLS